MNTIVSINEAIQLAEDGDFRRSFLIELHKYLKDKLPENQVDEYPKECSFDGSCTRCDSYKHFDKFCMLQGMHPYVAHSMLRLKYGDIGCDWEYFQYLKVTEEDPEPQRVIYVTKGRWQP
jgi:hypothetical protein